MDQQFVASLQETLTQVTLPDSAAIKAATAKLSNEFYPNPASLPAIIYILQNNPNDQIRQLAAVESRKLVNKHWETVDQSIKNEIKESILTSTFKEQSKLIRHSAARVVAAIAEYEFSTNTWESLLPLLVNAAVDDSNVAGKETSTFVLLSILETNLPELEQHVKSFLELFAKTLHDQNSNEVRSNSVLALGSVANLIESSLHIDNGMATAFKNLIPSMVDVLKEVIASGDEVISKQVFNSLNDLILLDTKLTGDNLIILIQIMTEIALNNQLDDEIRVFAFQFLTSAITFRKTKISSKKLGRDLTLAALKIASEEVDVEAELANDEDENENEENEPTSLALRLLTVASSELPPSQVVNPIFEQLNSLLSSTNQFERRAGFLAIGATATGAPDYYSGHLDKVVQAIVGGLKDSELLVRVSALRALAQLTSELQDLLAEFHEQLLPLVIEIIDSATNAVVYKYACTSLDTLIEFMSHDAIVNYLEPLMNKLFHMLQVTEKSSLRSIIVSAIGSTAYAAGTAFRPYFDKSVEILQHFIQNSASVEGLEEDDIELRALTFENISTMARAVGSESFSKYAEPLVDAAYTSINSENSRLRESGYAFVSNMAKVYKKDFAPFLPKVMPIIFKCLEQEEFNINVNEDDLEDGFDEEEDLTNKFQVHTGITIEKEIAAIALSELALGTKDLFAEYVEQAVETLSKQAEESYGMRETALACLWKVVEAMVSITVVNKNYPIGAPASSYVDANILNLIKHARELSIRALGEEYELSMVAAILDSFAELLKRYGAIIVIDNGDSQNLEDLCAELMQILKGEHLSQTLDDDEIPEDEEADASETDAMLFESALEVLVNLSLALGPDFNKIFSSFKDIIASNVTSKSKNKKVSAIGALAEIGSGLKSSNPYTDEFLQMFTQRLQNDKSVEVRGNAAYGIGVLIYHSNNNYSSTYPDIFNLLSTLLSKVQKQEANVEEDDEESKDVIHRSYANACGCVARLALKQQDSTPLNVVLPILFEHLPLQSAFEENTPIFELIAKLYQDSNEEIVQFTPKVVEVFADVFLKEAEREKLERESTLGREENIDRFKQFETPELKAKIVDLLKYLDSKYSGVVSQNAFLKQVVA
ncbi:Ran-binding protein 6 [Wickerhamomyces ciferrii]|uniref:Ran-binding protein 6 n=1 Tax=Wickerhamomyces ciferrii (strain ATCC 14091 / BCRC 22168 / CBS 111 / JCM 3599 / NBRC 0793 / NRRL Y-1031 F-60-10) TaxID=1206466 RepID=K0KRU5_WICCF|nr:Ran-binding protein 6 [Wickerhamomyces ciferrii]CCH44727.1 Ran-binding protein 6 [Wickerhamomyces ciferrii]